MMTKVKSLDQLNVDFLDSDDQFNEDEFYNPGLPYGNEDTTTPQQQTTENPEDNNEDDVDVITHILKNQGIQDLNSLKFIGDDGQEETHSFYDLSLEEQLDILNFSQQGDGNETTNGLDESEEHFINYLRTNNLTVEELINHARQEAVNEYLMASEGDIDFENISNEELYVLDLASRVEGLTEDEAKSALESELTNPSIFEKKMASIRTNYIEQEKLRIEEAKEMQNLEAQQSLEDFKNILVESAPNIKDIGRLELDQKDVEEAIDFLLAEDVTGQRLLAKALNDPESLIKMAWFYLKGDEAFNYMAEYYENQIKEHSDTNYQKGYEAGLTGAAPSRGGNKVVVKDSNKTGKRVYNRGNNTPITLNQLG